MSNELNQKRVAKNTLWMYFRMLFSMLIGLYTSRLILSALGAEDFGIYSVVGGLVAMFSMISGTMSTAVNRFLSFELGKADKKRIKAVFSTSLSVHVMLALGILILLETIGLWFLNNRMVIPIERILAANWVYQFSAFTFFLDIIGIPIGAAIIAHERMTVFAYLGIGNTIVKLLIVILIANTGHDMDRLIMYSALLALLSIINQSISWIYCRRNFEEIRLNWNWDKSLFKEIGNFAGWNFLATSAGMLKNQGTNILLNLFGGPIVNAARGIATTINGAISGFAINFMIALNPQITKSYAKGDKATTFMLVHRGSRFSFYVMLIFIIPIFIEIPYILSLWLGEYPDYTISFSRLILILSLSDALSNTLNALQLATGKIRNYQLIISGIVLLNFPLSYIALYMGASAESTLVIAIIISIITLFIRLWLLRSMAGLSMSLFIKDVLGKVLLVGSISYVLPYLLHLTLSITDFPRLVIVTAFSLIVSLTSILYMGCTQSERTFIYTQIRQRVTSVLGS